MDIDIPDRPFFSTTELARILRVGQEKVLWWVNHHQLAATNVNEHGRYQ